MKKKRIVIVSCLLLVLQIWVWVPVAYNRAAVNTILPKRLVNQLDDAAIRENAHELEKLGYAREAGEEGEGRFIKNRLGGEDLYVILRFTDKEAHKRTTTCNDSWEMIITGENSLVIARVQSGTVSISLNAVDYNNEFIQNVHKELETLARLGD